MNKIRGLQKPFIHLAIAMLLVVASVTATMALVQPSEQQTTAYEENGPLRMALIGDSYTAGINNDIVWPTLIAENPDLAVFNAAIPGAGYVGGTGESGPFSDQVGKALASKPQVLVVFGGINDVGKSSDLVTQSVTDLLFDLARRAPDTTRIVFGPIWHEDPPPEAAIRIDAAIAEGAQRTNTTYVRLVEKTWLVGPGLIQNDDIHPTDQGQSVLARELAPILWLELRKHSIGGSS